ncbi:probable serine/threonine-protein kinase PBL3 isoform X1 [Tanacetum coccineum]
MIQVEEDDEYRIGNCCTSRTLNAEEQIVLDGVKRFTLAELRQATYNFNETIGRGGFGTVYSGWVDEDSLAAMRSGMQVAVKKYIRRNPEGEGATQWLVSS